MYSEEALREREDDLAFESLSDGAYMSLALRQYAAAHGEAHPDQEWISTPYDTWEKNPFFTGTPGRHPEDYDDLPDVVVDAGISYGIPNLGQPAVHQLPWACEWEEVPF